MMPSDTSIDQVESLIPKAPVTAPYRTAIDIEAESLEMFHQWTGYDPLSDKAVNPKSQLRDFQIDLGMAILGFAALCKWTVRSRKIEHNGSNHIIYELRGFDQPQLVPMSRQNCSDEISNFLLGRLIRTLDFLRNCAKFGGIPHIHIISVRNHYVLSAVWKPYQNKIWMIPVDQVENLSFSAHLL